MHTEIELALRLPPNDQAAFASKVGKLFPKASPPHTHGLVGIYYDTPTLDLAQRGMGLRLRREGDAWVQTLKFGQTGSGGLNARTELNHTTTGQALELHAIADPAIRQFLQGDGIAPLLHPVFTTRVQRTQWQIPCQNGNVVELALDVGSIETNRHTVPVSEVEIELKQGEVDAVFAVAHKLAAHFSLLPQMHNKAEIGYQAYQMQAPRAVEGRTPQLHASMSPWEARQTVLLETLRHLQGNLMHIGHGNDMEFVHQARVALRRMRSADQAFAALPVDAAWRTLMQGARQLGQLLGTVRDRDVLAHETLPQVENVLAQPAALQTLKTHILAQREQAMQAVRTALADPAAGQWLLSLLQALHQSKTSTTDDNLASKLKKFAKKALEKRARAVEKLAVRWHELDEEQRHTLRKQVKKLRYAAEYFSSLYDEDKVKKYLAAQQAMQKVLGAMNDAVVAGHLLQDMATAHPETGFASGMAVGWYTAASQKAIDSAAGPLKSMRQAKAFW